MTNMAFESSKLEKMQRPKKIGSALAIAEYSSNLKGFLAIPKGHITSSAPSSTIVTVSERSLKP